MVRNPSLHTIFEDVQIHIVVALFRMNGMLLLTEGTIQLVFGRIELAILGSPSREKPTQRLLTPWTLQRRVG